MLNKIYRVRVNWFISNESEMEARSGEYIWYSQEKAREYLASRRDAALKEVIPPVSIIVDNKNELIITRQVTYNGFTNLRVEHVTLETIIA